MLMQLARKDRHLLERLLAAIEAMPPAAFATSDPVERVAAAAVDAEAVAELEAALAERDARIADLEAAAEAAEKKADRESAAALKLTGDLCGVIGERDKAWQEIERLKKAKPAVVGGMMDPPADPQQAGARKIMALQEEVRRLSDLVVRHGGKP